ncbi:conserved hypothetical protein [Ricinus communis]|uniref:Uncharacterized protein n=1 Tax=Ricinus communis TaxID=3988 RepID=B9T6K5_RICCO|nr:conserved hypothetical protein [Ricinus communis]
MAKEHRSINKNVLKAGQIYNHSSNWNLNQTIKKYLLAIVKFKHDKHGSVSTSVGTEDCILRCCTCNSTDPRHRSFNRDKLVVW